MKIPKFLTWEEGGLIWEKSNYATALLITWKSFLGPNFPSLHPEQFLLSEYFMNSYFMTNFWKFHTKSCTQNTTAGANVQGYKWTLVITYTTIWLFTFFMKKSVKIFNELKTLSRILGLQNPSNQVITLTRGSFLQSFMKIGGFFSKSTYS